MRTPSFVIGIIAAGSLASGCSHPQAREAETAQPAPSTTFSSSWISRRCVSSSDNIRSADTAARGAMKSMNDAIITDMRICTR